MDAIDKNLKLFDEIENSLYLQCSDSSRVLKLCFSSIAVVFNDDYIFNRTQSVPLEVVNMLWEGLLSLRKGLDDLENGNEIWRQYITPKERNNFIEAALQHAEAKNARLSEKIWLNIRRSSLPLFVSQCNPKKTGKEDKSRAFSIFGPQPDSAKTEQEKNRRKSIFFWDNNCNEKDFFGTNNNDNPIMSKNDLSATPFEETKPENKTEVSQGPHPSEASSSTVSILQDNNEIVPVVLEYIKDELKRLGLLDITIISGSHYGRNRKSDYNKEDGVNGCSPVTTDYVKDGALSTIDNSATGVRSCSMKQSMKRDCEVQYLKVTQDAHQQYGIHLSNLPITKGGFLILKEDGEETLENNIQDHEDNSNFYIWSNVIADSIVSKCEIGLKSPMVLGSSATVLESSSTIFESSSTIFESSSTIFESSPGCPNSDDEYWLFLLQGLKQRYECVAEDVWIYLLHMLPHHLMHAGRVEDAIELLSCQFFVLNRITVLGFEDGLQRYQKDCEFYLHKEKTEDSKKAIMSILYAVLEFFTTNYPSAKDIGNNSITVFLYRNETSKILDNTQKMAIGKGLHRLAKMLSREWEEEALEFYSEASKYLSAVKDDRRGLVPTFRNMAFIHAQLGEYSEAIKLYRGTLMIQEESIGTDGLSIAKTLKLLGIAYGIEKEYERALSCFEKELVIRKERLSEGHDLILDTYHRLGMIYTILEELDDAYACYSKCLDGYKLHGNNDALLTDMYQKLGIVLNEKGNKTAAINYYKEALNVVADVNGKDNIDAAKILQSMGKIYSEQSKQADAVSCYREAIKIRIKLEGENNKYVAETLLQLGTVHIHKKDYDQALEALTNALHIAESICESNEFLADTLCYLGMAHRMKGDLNKAMKCFGKAEKLGEGRPCKDSREDGYWDLNNTKCSFSCAA